MSTVVDNKGLEAPSPVAAFLKRNMQLLLVTVALFVVLAFFSVAVPKFAFATVNVYLDIVLQSAFTGVMALGATFVIATSGIDLSVGTGLSLVAVMAGVFLAGDRMNLPLGLGLLLTLLVGMAIGLINGLNVSILGLPPFIATLAMMMVARGTLAVSGSISAYKAADITSRLKKENLEVAVLMTEAATEFITPLTLQVLSQRLVGLDIMQEPDPSKVNHITIAKETDLFLLAPATANTIAKLANGLADNMVTATALALPTHTKKVLAPAMNTKMYENPLTQHNLERLQRFGWKIIQPREAVLACGDQGTGALAEIDTIIDTVKELIYEKTV